MKGLATALTSPPSPASDHARAVRTLVIVSSVEKVLEETTKSVSAGSRSWVASTKIRAVDIGHETARHGAIAVVPERFVRHHGPEVGTADADIDDIADTLAAVALPGAASDTGGELAHLIEHGVDLGHDILDTAS